MDVAERIALGVVDAERKRRERVVGAEVLELDGYVLAFTNQPDPALNGAVVEHEPKDAAGSLRLAEGESARRGFPLGVHLQAGRHAAVDRAVRSLGLSIKLTRPAMACDLHDLADAETPAGVEIRPVATDADVEALVAVGVASFEDDPEVGRAVYGAGSRGVEGVQAFLARSGDEPVGISTGYLVRGAVSVMGVAVMPEARRAGIGGALTLHAARAFPGADLAWLHPSQMARSMYESLGFDSVSDWEVWVRT